MKFPRSAGILLHISSLPGRYGIGDLGTVARDFAEFLKESGQTIWQILPLCPPANGNSPYSSYSAFANNSDLISPELMIQQGWGTEDALDAAVKQSGFRVTDSSEVDFGVARKIRSDFFRRAFKGIQSDLGNDPAYEKFCRNNEYWLDDFSLFESIARSTGQFDWCQWPSELAHRVPQALNDFRKSNWEEFEYSRFLQFVFECQWKELKSHCGELGIRIYGDLPIFVDHQSSDVWSHQEQFQLDANGKPEFVAGVPPDYFSPTGQKWGNPLYRWDVMEQTDFAWWTKRFRRSLDQFEIIRVDHFRGFEAYYQIPEEAPSAETGQWVKGPGVKPFQAAAKELGPLPIVAEDLGLITEEVNQLRDELGFPTMRVMQFGYGSFTDKFHRPESFPEHCFGYTGTHDNETLMGWYQNQIEDGSDETREMLLTQFDGHLKLASSQSRLTSAIQVIQTQPVHLQMIEAVLDSKAETAIIPIQDYLGLGNEARMNLPATADGNWKWKLRTTDEVEKLAGTIQEMTIRAGRSGSTNRQD